MGIDWFTFGAQIVNFLILVWLLRKFLYGPIINAMDRREAAIAERMAAADKQQREAETQAALYQEKNRSLDHRQEELMAEVQEAVKQRQKELLGEARAAVEHSRSAWYEALEREQTSLAQEIRRDTGVRAVQIARRALEDFADRDLHDQVVNMLHRRLSQLTPEQQTELRDALLQDDNQIVVTSAFPLSQSAEASIGEVLREKLGAKSELVFRRTDELMCGIEIRVGGQQISWSFNDYLDLIDLEFESAIKSSKPELLHPPAQ